MREPGPGREPILNLPAPLVVAILALGAIHGLRAVVSEMTDVTILLDLSFIPASWSLALGTASPEAVLRAAGQVAGDPDAAAAREALAHYLVGEGGFKPWSALTYGLLHGSWLHVGLNCVWLAAFGTPVVRRIGTARTALLATASTLGGALAQWGADPLAVTPTIGASAAVSGLMAGAATFVFRRASPPWLPSRPPRSRQERRRPDWSFLRERGAILFLLSWFAVNLLFGLSAVPLGMGAGTIAWQAHIGGLLVGLLLFPFIDPGPEDAAGLPDA